MNDEKGEDDGKRAGGHEAAETGRQVRMRHENVATADPQTEQQAISANQQQLLAEVNRLRATVQLQEIQLELLSTSRNRQQDIQREPVIEHERTASFFNNPDSNTRDQSNMLLSRHSSLRDILGQPTPGMLAPTLPNSASAGTRAIESKSQQISILQQLIREERSKLSRQIGQGVAPAPSPLSATRQSVDEQLRDFTRRRTELQLPQLPQGLTQGPTREQAQGPSNRDSIASFARMPADSELEESRRRIETLRNMIRSEQIANLKLEEEQLLQQAILRQKLQGQMYGTDTIADVVGNFSVGLPSRTEDVLAAGNRGYAPSSRETSLRELDFLPRAPGFLPAEGFQHRQQDNPREQDSHDDRKPSASAGIAGAPASASNPSSPKFKSPQVRRDPVPLELDTDPMNLSKSQQLIRSALEFFQASKEDVILNAQCRRNATQLFQVGLRCKFCSHEFLHRRGRGSVYYPARIAKVYQAAQNIAMTHLLGTCSSIPEELREEIKKHRETRGKGKTSSGGRGYWVESCTRIGLVDNGEENGIWFTSSSQAAALRG